MPESQQFVSRGGEKLEAAFQQLLVDPADKICADLGSHVGGFVDCLLQRGAKKVYSVDTSYGTLAWKLRKDPRVVVIERTNAMHVELPEPVDLVTVDVGWTPQSKILPRVKALLAEGGSSISLIKPHYEASKDQLESGVLPDDALESVVARVLDETRASGWVVEDVIESPIRGRGGNREFLAWLTRA